MNNRWMILVVLFLARLTMAFQFQSIAALSPFVQDAYGVGLAEIGWLIGLYLAPGVIVAIPGGAIAARFGDKRVVGLSIGLMLLGALMIWLAPAWGVVEAGRVIAGIGGVVLNIVMTKMLVDWFAGREVSTALAIFVNSWPIGIALALLMLPPVAAAGGLPVAWILIAGLIATGLVLFVLGYRPPEGAAERSGRITVAGMPIVALTCASLVWAFYNVALAMVFSFGPEVLLARGWELPSASALVSAFMIVFSVFVPFGGVIADRTGRRDTVILLSMASYFGLLLLIMPLPVWAIWGVTLLVAALFGGAAGPIMSLPSAVLSPQARAFGMGVFFSIYYGTMMVAPALAGTIAEQSGRPIVAIAIGAIVIGMAIGALALFRGIARAPESVRG